MRAITGLLLALAVAAPTSVLARTTKTAAAPTVCESCVRADMEALTSAAMEGRQCGSAGEAKAAAYIESRLKAAGVTGAYGGTFIQNVGLSTPQFASAPTLSLGAGPGWSHGQQFVVLTNAASLKGPLVRITDPAAALPEIKGAVVFNDVERPAQNRAALFAAGAAAVVETARPVHLENWAVMGEQWRQTSVEGVPGALSNAAGTRLVIKEEVAEVLRKAAPGTELALSVTIGEPQVRKTQNVVGVIRGSAADADRRAILLSAHYDHLGVVDGVLYQGADDDASGTSAVLEFARLLAKGPKPRRTVYFALFSCEEEGGLGSTKFRGSPPTTLGDLSANLQFEMVGLRDPKHPETLMMTGYDRSDFGATLAAQGAKIGPDPYPEENFFERSDNYGLALKGVVAHTVSAWPNPPLYHQPTDTLEAIDFPFMIDTIQSLVKPVRWLLDSDFSPTWKEGQAPK